MNRFEDALEARLERLEAGEPLSNCLEGLPEAEKQLLQLAASLRQLPLPQANPAVVVHQRSQLLASVPQAGADSTSFVGWWRAFFTTLPGMATALAMMGLMIWFSFYLLKTDEQSLAETTPASIATIGIDPTPPAEVEAIATGEETETAVIPPTAASSPSNPPAAHTYLPILEISPFIDAHTATVQEAVGLVEVQDKNGRWHQAKRGTTLEAGQRIRTTPLSKTKILFYDGSEATLSGNSELSLDQLDAQKPADGFRTILMTQWMGESQHQVAFRHDNGSRYEVNTPNGSGIARGTLFQVIVTPNLHTQFVVQEGRVDVTNQQNTVAVIAGQLTTINPNQPPTPPNFTISGQGEVTATGASWIIGGQLFATTASTVTIGNPQIGDIAHVTGYRRPDGTIVAITIVLLHHNPTNRFTLTGEVAAMGDSTWVVAGKTIAITPETSIDAAIVSGNTVRVQGRIMPAGTLTANTIERIDNGYPFAFVGVVATMGSDSWTISGIEVGVNGETAVTDGTAVGDVVQVRGHILPDGTWLAATIARMAEEADFAFSGHVSSLDPWTVAGIELAIDDFTQIDATVTVGSLVHVSGQILADGTWLATAITLLDGKMPLHVTFVGTVDGLDPWVVAGISLAVDGETAVSKGIASGDTVRITAVILPDGTFLAITITLIPSDTLPIGCFTLATTILSSDDGTVTLSGLPPIVLDEQIPIEGELAPNAIVIITLCTQDDGTIIVITIVVIYAPPPPPPPTNHDNDDDDSENSNNDGRVTVCHKGRNTLTIARSALNAHLGHGDQAGPCP